MKPYTKEDVEFVLREYNERIDALLGDTKMLTSPALDTLLAEHTVGVRRLTVLLDKPEDKWTFDDYMAFYRVKEFLS